MVSKRYYIAFDEVNPELDRVVVSGIISSHPEDANVYSLRGIKKLNRNDLVKFFREGGREWYVVSIPRCDIKKKSRKPAIHPIIQAAPKILRTFMVGRGRHSLSLDIMLDGNVPRNNEIRDVLTNKKVEIVGVREFPKCQRSSGEYPYTHLLRVADAVAKNAAETLFSPVKKYSNEESLVLGGNHIF